jgi:hypothetical protein
MNMSQQTPDAEGYNSPPQPEPLKFEPPTFDYVERDDQSGYETRARQLGETK